MTIEVNEYNSECTRVVLHIYEGFTWYIITIIVPTRTPHIFSRTPHGRISPQEPWKAANPWKS